MDSGFKRMFKLDIEATQSKSVKSKKQIEIITTNNQNKEFSEKHKSEGKKKKKHKVKTILNEANALELPSYPEACSDLKSVKKKKSKSKSSSILEEDQGSKIEKKLTKEENPPEGEIQENVCSGLKKKKKKKCKQDDYSGPQTFSEGSHRKMCQDEVSRVQNETKHVKRIKKDDVKHVDVEEGSTLSTKTSDGTADEMTEAPCVAVAKSMKKKKRSHTENIETHEGEKSPKKQKRDKHSGELKTGNDQFIQADVRKQEDDQTVDNQMNQTDKKCTKKKKKKKLHSKRHLLEPKEEHSEPPSMENERNELEQTERVTECITKLKKKKRKRSISAEGEEIEKLDKERIKFNKTSNACKSQNSPSKVTAKGEKQATALDVPEESVKKKKKIRREKKDTSAGTQVFKVKAEQCDSDDLQIISERKGNLFEVTIDKARRQALQEEIDRESGKTDTSEPRASSEIKPLCTGTQWDTATFESVDKKNKFLRLMGGFKSSNQPQSTGHVSGKPNMALNKQEEQKFNSILQKEFDKALNLRQNRGTGLGFQASPDHAKTKTFFIDKHASKSKKFDLD
ncbi:lysine-rich nucleolar protein 1-like [Pristis pectinata]|uniref:lysine-rich nucleolar protein 1-like n=1 Tax=Pristis pectinata TaxID=685728 RepID=UPI00223CE91F|nr:lysine-rich nucleolar protein 1-like [Pristis pectinata]